MKTITMISLLGLLWMGRGGAGISRSVPDADLNDSNASALVRLRRIYRAELGVREATGNNDGSRVEEYLKYVGLKKGNPWCAAFVCWAFGRAGIANPESGYCPDLFRQPNIVWTRKRGVRAAAHVISADGTAFGLTRVPAPSPGDVFGLYFPEKGRIAHVGFVDDWGDTYVVTCEGNTNEAGSREGDGVYRKRRPISAIYEVARYNKVLRNDK